MSRCALIAFVAAAILASHQASAQSETSPPSVFAQRPDARHAIYVEGASGFFWNGAGISYAWRPYRGFAASAGGGVSYEAFGPMTTVGAQAMLHLLLPADTVGTWHVELAAGASVVYRLGGRRFENGACPSGRASATLRRTMKAAVLRGLRELVVVDDAPMPVIGPKDILLRSRACGICGTDLHIYDGEFFPTYPLVQGHELAGEVAAVGSEVTTLAVGDKVMVDPTVTCDDCHFCMTQRQNHCLAWNAVGVTRDGGFGEYVRVPARNCYRFDRVSFSEAAFTEPLACVVFGQDRARIDIGSEVLILGAGPIGQLQLQASRANGAASVTVVDTVESKLDMARRFGAAHTVIADNAMDEKLRKIARYGFDVVIDATGSPRAVQSALTHIAPGGRFLVFGVCSPDATIEIKPFDIYRRDLEIIGSFAIRRTYDRAFKLMEAGVVQVKELIAEAMPVEELARGFETLRSGRAGMKLQVVWS